MGPEVWLAIVAVFISGGAVGSAGMLLAQWLMKKIDGEGSPRRALEAAELDVLRSEVADMGRKLRNLDGRLDFTEQLLGGALPLTSAPRSVTDGGAFDGTPDEEGPPEEPPPRAAAGS